MTTAAYKEPLRHPAASAISLAEILKALADPTRLEIVRALARDESAELTCGDLAATCASKQLLSHHMRTLREVGLTLSRDEGRHRYTRLRRETLDSLFPGFLDGVLVAADREARRRSRGGRPAKAASASGS